MPSDATPLPEAQSVPPLLLWAGSYTPEFGGRGVGLTPLATSELDGSPSAGAGAGAGTSDVLSRAGAAQTALSPSFAVAHPSLGVLYTADESQGTVSAFAVDGADPARLTALAPSQPAGPAVCHVAVDPGGRFVAATCWGDGSVLLYPLASDGSLGAPTRAPAAADPHAADRPPHDEHTDSPPSSRAHMALPLGLTEAGERMLATTDLGYDLVRFWTVAAGAGAGAGAEAGAGAGAGAASAGPDSVVGVEVEWTTSTSGTEEAAGPDTAAPEAAGPDAAAPDTGVSDDHTEARALRFVPAGEVVMPLGCGPRHLVRLPDGRLLVVTEYSVEVLVLEPVPADERGSASAPYRLAAVLPVLADGPADGDSGAEIALSTDSRFVYVGVRGSNRIATLDVADGLTPLDAVDSGGRTPRHHLVVGDLLHIAHQDSDEVTSHRLGADGRPAGIVGRLPLGSPTVLAPR
jgi:6-phosphogluconolactonase (cycloisomerase 2 family)